VHLEQFSKLLSGKGKALTIHSVLMPSVVNEFASVLIAGANFEDTGLFTLWSKMGVRFEADVGFTDELRYRTHTNGNLATVHFALDRNWSRHLWEQSTDGKSNLERLRDAAKSIVDGREFLWQANKSVPDNFFRGCGQRLPNNPLGLNEFDTVHDMVFLSALNPSPAHAKFLHYRGLTSEEIERQGYCGVAYQAVMRTSLEMQPIRPRKISLYLMNGSRSIWPTCCRAQPSRRWILVSLTKRIRAVDLGFIRIMLKKCGAGGRTKQKGELLCWPRYLLQKRRRMHLMRVVPRQKQRCPVTKPL
jgi:hypothetical protein